MSASDIISRLSSRFDNALSSADLLFFPSTVHKHTDGGVEYQIRLCPSLALKPVLPATVVNIDDASQDDKKKFDPFAPPYNPNLFVGELRDEETGEEYCVLLNKFSIVPQHFVLVTKQFEPQSSPLLPPDLVQTYRLILAAHDSGKHFIAFYNCGKNSGASQPHKHIQFIPVDDADGPPIERLARSANLESPGKPFSITSLPYANHVIRLPSSINTGTNGTSNREHLSHALSQAFLALLDLTISTIRHDADYPAGKPSYNVIVTREHMHLIPRRYESPPADAREGSPSSGGARMPLSVNALGFAGMLVAKSEEELEAVKREGVGKILRSVGLESVHDLQVAGTAMDAMDTNQAP